MTVPGDNPIRDPEDDILGRASIAKSFVDHVLSLDASAGLTVGVLGVWGSGKTSFVNLARSSLKDSGSTILDFNPWMFSGAEQLVESFFIELAAQLKLSPGLSGIGKSLEEYGDTFSGMAWLPLVGPWIERSRLATTALGKMLQRRREGVGDRRAKLETALSTLDKRIVVVLDDIDRLSTPEIRDVFRLVRLTASFPNIIYIVAFDRARVEHALDEPGVPGRDYLEKIVQVAIDLPAIPNHVLDRQIFSAVDDALKDIENHGPLNEEVWPDVFLEVIRPLIRNMRDVRRYAAAVHGTVGAINGQIALADLLALEAVRVFLPDVFACLHSAVDGLTGTLVLPYGGQADPRLKEQIDRLVEAAGAHDDVARAMISRLFPAGERHIHGMNYGGDWNGRWLRDRRVAHEEILRLYLERTAGEGFQAFARAERAWTLMSNRDALDGYLRSLDPDRLEDVIASLEAYEDQFGPEVVVPGTIVLLNLLPDLPEKKKGMFDIDTRLVVGRVTYRLLKALESQDAVEADVRKILPELKTLSAKSELITQVGYRENAGHKLVSEVAAAEFEKVWREEVRTAPTEDLEKECDLARILSLAKREAGSSEGQLIIPESPGVTLALLKSARGEVRSQSGRTIRRSPRLVWDALVDLYGDEATLRNRIETLKATNPEGEDDLLDLADRYLGGWRPKDFEDD